MSHMLREMAARKFGHCYEVMFWIVTFANNFSVIWHFTVQFSYISLFMTENHQWQVFIFRTWSIFLSLGIIVFFFTFLHFDTHILYLHNALFQLVRHTHWMTRVRFQIRKIFCCPPHIRQAEYLPTAIIFMNRLIYYSVILNSF